MVRKALLSALLAMPFTVSPAAAVSLQNRDAEPIKVIVTVLGVRTDVEVAPNAGATICEAGCFLTFPNGEVLPLAGTERVIYETGRGRLQP